jgi:hypothetical protein
MQHISGCWGEDMFEPVDHWKNSEIVFNQSWQTKIRKLQIYRFGCIFFRTISVMPDTLKYNTWP